MSIIVRKAELTDDEGIFDVEREAFSLPWSLASIQRELADPERTIYYVLEQEDGLIAGYAGLWQVLDEGQITNIALRSKFRRKGYGELLVRVLMEAAWEAGCNDIFLEVRVSNTGAQALYRRHGFVPIGRRRRYYLAPVEDALVMRVGTGSHCAPGPAGPAELAGPVGPVGAEAVDVDSGAAG